MKQTAQLKYHKMNVLSLFDGMSCGRIALERAGIKVDNYFASEIDKWAIQVSKANWPDIVQVGDVMKVYTRDAWNGIDLLIGGSPCQSFSVAGNQTGFDGKSGLFYEYVRILNALKSVNPEIKFMLENVKMKKEWRDVISKELGVEPIEINSALVSAQNRKRLYWTNIPSVSQPMDKYIFLRDILLNDAITATMSTKEHLIIADSFNEKSQTILSTLYKENAKSMIERKKFGLLALHHTDAALSYMNKKVSDGRTHWDFAHHSDIVNEKSSAVVSNFFKGVPYNVLKDLNCIRKFHPIECERLQTLPDNYTSLVSNTQRYKMIGNGWTVDVIAHIFKGLKQ